MANVQFSITGNYNPEFTNLNKDIYVWVFNCLALSSSLSLPLSIPHFDSIFIKKNVCNKYRVFYLSFTILIFQRKSSK